jgi:hypothetical protein
MKREWHQPKIQLLDARATASTDADLTLADPVNHNGDLGEWKGEAAGPGGTQADAS